MKEVKNLENNNENQAPKFERKLWMLVTGIALALIGLLLNAVSNDPQFFWEHGPDAVSAANTGAIIFILGGAGLIAAYIARWVKNQRK